MNRPLTSLLLLSAALAPACAIYDAELLEQAVGGEGASGSSQNSGGQDSGGGLGDGDGDGGDSPGTGGDSGGSGGEGGDVGNTGGTGGVGSGGDGAGGDGAGGGSGGTEPGVCNPDWGDKAAFTSVASTDLLDDFQTPWRKFGDGVKYTGQWFAAYDMETDGTDASPTVDAWVYEEDPCTESDSLHVVGTGFTTWGASLDAELMTGTAAVNLSAFTGVGFWARSPGTNQIKVFVVDADGTTEATPRLITAAWKQFLIPFPAAADKTTVKLVKLAIVADENIDVWIDDVVFYVAD